MKKPNLYVLSLFLAVILFAGCTKSGNNSNTDSSSATTDPGAVINGIKWATRNVDAPGTFAAAPESTGMYYQWNSKVGWSISTVNWNIAESAYPSDGKSVWNPNWNGGGNSTWIAANDPSPVGWRVPTEQELASLCDGSKVNFELTIQNGQGGMKFTDKATGNSIFLPAANGIDSNGSGYGNPPSSSYNYGNYWSSDLGSYGSYYLQTEDDYDLLVNDNLTNPAIAYSLRCVKN